ncbi:hypothetical protein PAPHI01_0324 [Pancytospora philotis]|nr:hypothetical protein PAPHI01_0324 [Pancytospora philotis]
MRTPILLLLARGYGALCESDCGKCDFAPVVYKEFGESEIFKLNALETHALGPLSRYCMAYDCPELLPALLDRCLPRLPPNDRARCLIFSVARNFAPHQHEDAPLAVLRRLIADFGFGSHVLLLKLFSSPYIDGLAVPPYGATGRDGCRLFADHVKLHLDSFAVICSQLQKKVDDESGAPFSLYNEQNEKGCGRLNYALLLSMKNDGNIERIRAELFHTVRLWLDDYASFTRQLATVSGRVRDLLQSSINSNQSRSLFAKSLVRNVASRDQREYFDFICRVLDESRVKRQLTKLFKECDSAIISPHFVAHYLVYIRAASSTADVKIHEACVHYFKNAPAFVHQRSVFKERQDYFNLIAPAFLFGVFKYLKDMPVNSPVRNGSMLHFMRLLSIDSFLTILMLLDDKSMHGMMRFMLSYIDSARGSALLSHVSSIERRIHTDRDQLIVYAQISRALESLGHKLHALEPVATGTVGASR